MINIVERILMLCKESNLSINELAVRSCLNQSTVNNIVSGANKYPRIDTLNKICEGFDISILDFLDDETEDLSLRAIQEIKVFREFVKHRYPKSDLPDE